MCHTYRSGASIFFHRTFEPRSLPSILNRSRLPQILAAAVVGGKFAQKHVPSHIRHLISAESGCNDGAAFPFLYLGIFLTLNPNDTGKAIGEWFYDAWLFEVALGIVLGGVIGFTARKLMKFSDRRGFFDRQSVCAVSYLHLTHC